MAASEAGKPWHGPDGRFRNPPGSKVRGGSRAEWWAFFGRRFKDGRTLRPGLPSTMVLPPAEVRQGIAALGTDDGVTWLGHASFLIRLGGLRLLTDPFLSDHASPAAWLGPRRHTPPALRAAELPALDGVLVSHSHYDHLDRPALAAVPGRERLTLVAALGMSRYLADLGYARVVELDWHQETRLGAVTVTAMPALHFSRRGPFDYNRALWCGFRLTGAAHAVHFAGDTAYGPVFKAVGERYPAPDLALLPVGAYDPRELMQASHCTPEEAVAIGRELGAKALCAMHWGAITLTDEPTTEPPERFKAAAAAAGYPPERALVLKVGESWRLA